MKNAILLLFTTLALALPSFANDRHQSFISYDDGGTIVRTGDDGREIDAHRNLPIYPGDEVITDRRGRTEIRLSDGNIIGVDRSTTLLFRSILDAYEGDGDETIADLRAGKIAVQRTDLGRDHVRVDTENASYLAEYEAIYSVETDRRGRDRVVVFEGSVEVRTPRRSTLLRRGESLTIDEGGMYDLMNGDPGAADDFERWFLRRAERFENYNNRYVDRRLGYWADELDDHGRWVFVTGIGWSWRPYVAVGWRPYHQGYWHRGRHGSLTWVSYDPWGWGPYHYGRWAYDPGYGWIWVPGYGYSPAWVYWWYGSGYVGWAPAGWWDCHPRYYDWAYRPYRHADFGFGFHGRIRVNEMDLRPWTFVDPSGLVSSRIDRAALTTDAIKHRLGRSSGGYDRISATPARFTREELRDPAAAIRRAGLGRDDSAATAPDMTAYFRRDANISGGVRDRILGSRISGPADTRGSGSTTRTPDVRGGTGGGRISRTPGVAPVEPGSGAPIGRGSVAPITGGSPAPISGGDRRGDGGAIQRGETPAQPQPSVPDRGDRTITRGRDDGGDSGRSGGGWRDRVQRPEPAPVTPPPSATAPPADDANSIRRPSRDGSWRSRVRTDSGGSSDSPAPRTDDTSTSGERSVPRRVIEGIGGARIYPRDGSGSSTRSSGGSDRGSSTRSSGGSDRGSSTRSSGGSDTSRDTGRSGRSSIRPSRPSSDGGSSRSSGGSSASPRSSGGSSGGSSASSGGSSSGGSGNRGGGGRIKRDQTN